jgi:hypothetical protein
VGVEVTVPAIPLGLTCEGMRPSSNRSSQTYDVDDIGTACRRIAATRTRPLDETKYQAVLMHPNSTRNIITTETTCQGSVYVLYCQSCVLNSHEEHMHRGDSTHRAEQDASNELKLY